jgi:hypothetical protein
MRMGCRVECSDGREEKIQDDKENYSEKSFIILAVT